MTRWVLLAISLLLLGLGLLMVFKTPDWLPWIMAVMTDQFGYLLAVIPVGVAGLAWRWRGGHGCTAAITVGLCFGAAALLERPCFQAWIVGRRLPLQFDRAFGPAKVSESPFAVGALFRRWPEAAPKATWTYSGSQQLDFYPAIGRRPAPCVIVVHGGGWDNGDRGQISQFNSWLARAGYAVADISYRLAPAAIWPAQREDLVAAAAFVKAHAALWGVDARRLVILGRSAGGQIAEASAYASNDPAIRGVIGLYAPADMNFAWEWGRPDDALNSPLLLRHFLGGTPQTARAAYDSASAILWVNSRTPPTLLVHGTLDTLVWNRQSLRLADRLSGSKVPNLLVSIPWATHALEYNLSGPSGQLTTYAVARFLASVCR